MSGYLGEIRIFAGQYEPENWMFCDGRPLKANDNPPLASVLGAESETFHLPDLRGRLVVGADIAPTASAYRVGDTGGTDLMVVSANEQPAHTHTIYASSQPANSASPSHELTLATVPSNMFLYVDTTAGSWTTTTHFSSLAIGAAGGSQPHENMMPSIALNYIICVNGEYPSE